MARRSGVSEIRDGVELTNLDQPLFEQFCKRGEQLLRANQLEESLACHVVAEKLYSGPLYADIPLKYSENAEYDWCWSRRYWLEQMYVKMLTYSARIHRQLGSNEKTIECAEKALKSIDFARELSDFQPDHASIQDAFESEMLDDEISDTRARSVASASTLLRSCKEAAEIGGTASRSATFPRESRWRGFLRPPRVRSGLGPPQDRRF